MTAADQPDSDGSAGSREGRDEPAGRLGPQFHRLLAVSAASNLADGVFRVAVPLLAVSLTRSPLAVAAVTVAGRLPWLLFALHAGAFADRLDRRRTMASVNVARAVVIGTLGLLAGTGNATLPILIGAAFVLGVAETLFDTAAQSIIPNLVDRPLLSRANGHLGAVELSMNQFVGPPLGGVIAAVALAWAFVGSGVAYLVAALGLLGLQGSFRSRRPGPATTVRHDIATGVRHLRSDPLLRTLALLVGGMNLISAGVEALLPVVAIAPGPLGLSPAGYGALWAAGGVGSLVGSLLADPLARRVGRRRLLTVNVVAAAAIPAALALSSSATLVASAFVAVGVTGMIWNVITVSLRQAIVPDHLLGRVNAGYRLMAWGTMPVGAALAGVGAELVGTRAVFLVSTVLAVLLVLPMRSITDRAIEAAEADTRLPSPG